MEIIDSGGEKDLGSEETRKKAKAEKTWRRNQRQVENPFLDERKNEEKKEVTKKRCQYYKTNQKSG